MHLQKNASLIARYTNWDYLRSRLPQLEDQDLVWLHEYLMTLVRRNCVAGTLSGAIDACVAFLRTIKGHRLLTITPRDVEQFIEHQQDHGLQPSSINRQLSGLSAFYHYLCENERRSQNPILWRHHLETPEPLPRALSRHEYQRLLSVIRRPRDRAIFLLLLRSGIRIGELVMLTLEDVRLAHHELTIPRGSKNRRGRMVYFSRDAGEALQLYLQHRPESPSPFLFLNPHHQPLTTRTIQRLFKGYAQQAGLNPEYTPHCLRHTFASELLNAGADLVTIQHLLGHDTISLTQRYARLSDQRKRQVYDQAMARLHECTPQEVSDVA